MSSDAAQVRRSIGDVGALLGADVELARTADLLLGILDHLLPLRDPADGAGDREQHA